MFYPNHHTRTYCIYLGSITYQDHNYDLGVYIHPDKSVSHDIVFGNEDYEYMSGEIIFRNVWQNNRFTNTLCLINEILYKDYCEKPEKFSQPENFKQR